MAPAGMMVVVRKLGGHGGVLRLVRDGEGVVTI
jgi:hypothetical protein